MVRKCLIKLFPAAAVAATLLTTTTTTTACYPPKNMELIKRAMRVREAMGDTKATAATKRGVIGPNIISESTCG